LPKMNTANGSYIKLGSNDYLDTDFSNLSWLGVVDGGVFTLDGCRAKPYNENWDTNNDWIMPGSKNHKFFLRLTNFWDQLKFVKKADNNNKEYVQALLSGNINWDFCKNTQWKNGSAYPGYDSTYPSGNFPTTFSENIVDYNDPWATII
jgi:hypothetical protein